MIVADTHAWIWWISQPKLLPRAAAEAMANGFGIAAISSWEVAMLAEKRRISLDAETLHWLREATVAAGVAIFDLTVDIAARSAALPRDVGRDPADRMIVATAIEYGLPLVTKDDRIRRANVVETIW